MTKKLSNKDKNDWQNFLNSKEKLENKDKIKTNTLISNLERSIDLHGYNLEEANKVIFEFIENCFYQGVNKINIITGKGLRSKNLDDPYQSRDLSILKYSVPEFIKNNSKLTEKILKIDYDAVNSSSKGSFDIFLKKKIL